MTANNRDLIERQRAALKSSEEKAYSALRTAEDVLFDLEDRVARRGDLPSVEGV